jgi:Ca2+-transporting ATPase
MDWHAVPPKSVLERLRTFEGGLSAGEAARRLGLHGPNSIAIERKISPLGIFINQFRNMLVLLLLLAAFVSLALSFINPEEAEMLDALLIFAIVIANAVLGFVQEYKAEKSIEALTKMSAPLASVLRGGREVEIRSEDVVPGDILLLGEGDKVAADARLIECFSLYADESMLTGESVPAHKGLSVLEQKTTLAERSNMVYMNSVVTRGKGSAVVVHTGLKTEIGKIAKEISEAPEKVTQFQIEIGDIGKKVSFATVGILVVIAATEFLLRTGDLLFIFMTAVALGVAAIPEGLPAVVTLALSIATNRMLKQNALMRRLSTVQDLGSVDVICTDKTGTLTENVMTVTRIYFDGKPVEVSGKGTELEGKFVPVPEPKEMEMLLLCGLLCNDARQLEGSGPGKEDRHFKGDPTEIAVLIPAYKAGLGVEAIRKRLKRVGEVPFSAERKLMSTANSDGRTTYSFVKGAPEMLLSRCTSIIQGGTPRELTGKDREEILGHNRVMASHALRVLGFAYKESPASFEEADMENGLVFLGLMGMKDPPRSGVREAVDDCRRAGIRVIMITGDNRYTAEAVGRELGFTGAAMTGDELDALSEAQLARTAGKTDIYARTSPKHKVLLLRTLQKNGHIVCMTGDGVNDAAAIKNSDVGIAMGIRGTEVTKQASDIIILDDNFITIRNAIAEGRGTFDNIRKFVAYLLGANISEVLFIFLATITALGISPKIAVQLLWINLVTDGLPAIALGVDPPANGIMQRLPRKKGARMIDLDTLYFLGSIGLAATLVLLLLYAFYMGAEGPAKAYSILFTSFVVLEMLTVYAVRWRYGTDLLSNAWLHIAVFSSIALQFVLLYTPLNSLFGIVPLSVQEWFGIVTAMAGYLLLVAAALKLEPLMIRK